MTQTSSPGMLSRLAHRKSQGVYVSACACMCSREVGCRGWDGEVFNVSDRVFAPGELALITSMLMRREVQIIPA